MSLALDFLRLQLKIPSQVVQFIEKLAAACVASRKAHSESGRDCLATAMAVLHLRRAGSACTGELTLRPLPAFIPA